MENNKKQTAKSPAAIVPAFGRLRGQAAMEYLMTYGWALLVIVVVLAALLFLNPFRAPEQCTFDTPSLVCGKPLLSAAGSSGDAKLYGKITNGFPSGIKIYGVNCTDATEAPGPMPTEGEFTPANSDYAINGVDCTRDSGAPIMTGEDFSGRLYVYYSLLDDGAGFPKRVATATVTAKAQATQTS